MEHNSNSKYSNQVTVDNHQQQPAKQPDNGENVIGNQKPKKCPKCDKAFRSNLQFHLHLVTHKLSGAQINTIMQVKNIEPFNFLNKTHLCIISIF